MVSSKTVFLGVYMSGGLLRLLFLPLCYLFLLFPFALLSLRYFKLDQEVLRLVPTDYKTPDTWPQIFIALVTVFLATRLISGVSNSHSKHGGKRRVQLLPFWIPGVRHWGNFVFGGERWLKSIRQSSISDIVAYNYSGAKHNLFFSPALLDRVVGNTNALEEAELTKWITLRNAFSLPKSVKSQYLELQPSISKTLQEEIFKGRQLQTITAASIKILAESLPDFITFNASLVDQLSWERVAGIELTDGTEEAECDLFALVNEFVCNVVVPPITGPQFPESYQLLGSDLETFNKSFYALALGFPRFFPLPGLPGASLAKKRLLQNLSRLFGEIMNPASKRVVEDDESMSGEETDADTPTPVTALNDLFSEHDLPISARAAITLELIQRLVARIVPLAFWTIVHVYSTSSPSAKEKSGTQTPLEKIREETKGWAEAIQPPSIHPSFPAPPEISFASPSPLFNPASLYYLRSCIFEAKRLYTSSITTAKITKPIMIADSTALAEEEEWQLDVGSFIDIGLSQRLINTSPANYLSPEQWKPDRIGNVQSPSYLASSIFDDSEEFVTAILIAIVAGVSQLWDISAAPKKGFLQHMEEAQAEMAGQKKEQMQGRTKKVGVWKVPKAVEAASVLVPKSDIRVRIKRREGLNGPKTMRKGR